MTTHPAPALLRIVFMGTPEFAVPTLRALAAVHEVVAVVTAPDKPAGRGKKISLSAVKEAALELSIPVLQPTNLKEPTFHQELSDCHADLFVVVAFRMLPEVVWAMPPKGTINLHGSLLPAYRGAAPINRAIMNGESVTGLTTFFIERDIDTGAVIDRVSLAIGPNETAGELHDRMMVAGATLLLNTVNLIAMGKAEAQSQLTLSGNEPMPSAPKIFRDDCRIDWSQSAARVHNHIRGLSPYPAAFSDYIDINGQLISLKILESMPVEGQPDGAPGTFTATRQALLVNTSDGRMAITSLQAPGKRRMRTAEFLNGYSFPQGAAFLP